MLACACLLGGLLCVLRGLDNRPSHRPAVALIRQRRINPITGRVEPHFTVLTD